MAKDDRRDRSRLINRLADLIEKNADELARLESLDNGKPFSMAKAVDVAATAACYRYYAGWADKVMGKTIQSMARSSATPGTKPSAYAGRLFPGISPC